MDIVYVSSHIRFLWFLGVRKHNARETVAKLSIKKSCSKNVVKIIYIAKCFGTIPKCF